jgi:hypothetical protein
MSFTDTLPIVYCLTFILCCLILRKFADDARKVVQWSVETVTKTGGTIDVTFLVIVCGLGLQAFGTGFYDNFWPIEKADMAHLGWWQVAACLLKSCSFAIGIMVGYMLNPRNNGKDDKTTVSTTTTKTENPPPPNP